jgi:hypothetical protein
MRAELSSSCVSDWTDLCAVREMALGLPNNLNPREVFEQVQLWSQNRDQRVLIDDYDGNEYIYIAT